MTWSETRLWINKLVDHEVIVPHEGRVPMEEQLTVKQFIQGGLQLGVGHGPTLRVIGIPPAPDLAHRWVDSGTWCPTSRCLGSARGRPPIDLLATFWPPRAS